MYHNDMALFEICIYSLYAVERNKVFVLTYNKHATKVSQKDFVSEIKCTAFFSPHLFVINK